MLSQITSVINKNTLSILNSTLKELDAFKYENFNSKHEFLYYTHAELIISLMICSQKTHNIQDPKFKLDMESRMVFTFKN